MAKARWWAVMGAVWLCQLSCGGVIAVHEEDSATRPQDTETTGDDTHSTSPETDTHGDSDTAPPYPRPCADLYAPDLFPTFEFEISPEQWQGVIDDCAAGDKHHYRPMVLRYGDETASAMVRLKGNWSWSCEKLQFVVSFNETNPDGRFHGLRKLVLDAPWYDRTFLHERLAMHALGRHGVPSSCVNSARVVVNGEYYGLYANVERLDHEYLERHFEEHDGNLYDGGQELKTNEDTADTSRRDAYWAAANLAELDVLVELDQAVDVWAGLAMLPDPDSVWAGVEINFYLYDHPTRGFLYLPYDTDISFNASPSVDPITYEHSGWLREPQYKIALSDSQWCERFTLRLAHARAAYDVADLEARLDEWSAQIADAAALDPHRPFSYEEHQAAVAELRGYFGQRAGFVDEWLAAGGHCPPVWPEDAQP